MYRALMTLTLAGGLMAGASALAQTPDNTQPDNTKVNKRDRQAAEESKSIENKATEVAGAGNVKNELSIKDDTVSKNN